MSKRAEVRFPINEAFDPKQCTSVREITHSVVVGAQYHNTRFENGYNDGDHGTVSFYNCTFEHCLFYNWLFERGATFCNCFFRDCEFVRVFAPDIDFSECVLNSTMFILNADTHRDFLFQSCIVKDGSFYIYESNTKAIRESEALDVSIWFKNSMIDGIDLESVPSKNVFVRESFFSGAYPSSNSSYVLPVCPPVGSFVAFKKAWWINRSGNKLVDVVVKLKVLDDAQRVSGVGRKCRCSAAEVLDIYDPATKEHYNKARSCFNVDFVYEVGQVVTVEDFDPKPLVCSRGIHFFLSEGEAIEYNF